MQKLLDNLNRENQLEILVSICAKIISCTAKFLNDQTNLHLEKEYRIFAINNGSNSDSEIIELDGKKGIYTKEIPFTDIKEIVLGPNCQNFKDEEKKIRKQLKVKFSEGQYDHLLIRQSQTES